MTDVYPPAGGQVTLKKLQRGYSWEVTVPASGASLQEMQEASTTAQAISAELDQKYGESSKPRIAEEEVAF